MNAVRSLLFLFALVAVTLTLLLAGATGVGALLHRLVPAVELGPAVVAGVVALSVSLNFVLNLSVRADAVREELDEAELEELVTAIHRPSRGRRPRR